MKTLLHILLLSILAVSCVQKTLYDPDIAKVVVKVNWDKMNEADSPDIITVQLAGKSITTTRDHQPDTILISSGNHDVYAFNTPSGIAIENGVANIGVDKDGKFLPCAEVFYSAFGEISANRQQVTVVELTPERQMRQLVLAIAPSRDTIMLMTGTLSSVAQSFDIQAAKEENAGTVILSFINDTCYINLFGIVGSSQSILLNIVTNRLVKEANIDLSEALSGFNIDKSQPKALMIVP